jgi:hypothetical protein
VGGIKTCFLNAKFSESGTWQANVSLPTGSPQHEEDVPITFNPRYPLEPHTLKIKYLNEAEALAAKVEPCLGSTNEPTANAGNLCVYRGATKPAEAAGDKGILEPKEIPAPANTFVTPGGEFLAQGAECNKENGQCQTGVSVVFRTKGFTEAVGNTTEPTYLNARGSWTVTGN